MTDNAKGEAGVVVTTRDVWNAVHGISGINQPGAEAMRGEVFRVLLALEAAAPATPTAPGGEGEAINRADLIAAYEAEIQRVSTLEYNSNAICRYFFMKVLERLTALRAQQTPPARVQGAEGASVVVPKDLRWDYMPSYGEIAPQQLIEAVASAQFDDRTAPLKGISRDRHIGHQMVPAINFNSLNRIVSAFVCAALTTPPAPASADGVAQGDEEGGHHG
ncbi:hypothetical protein SAMN02745194_04919 [Roseomonas rosea]|uniref:Uncharacterized protein n=1 Tax=Muricoccus roseus TaxID=198092 RepID=A0A1M6SH28_9PROT|nr:hypothetical protein [Roseomonas rosea]SHK43808.1 hypothetical protein SAMN02745194_04919 [Roseomonas rosea]